jgi:hypothetical protein
MIDSKRIAIKLGHFTCGGRGIFDREGKKYVNPHTSGDDVYLEDPTNYKYVKYENGKFVDSDGYVIYISF